LGDEGREKRVETPLVVTMAWDSQAPEIADLDVWSLISSVSRKAAVRKTSDQPRGQSG
jgi:hypothetical protein